MPSLRERLHMTRVTLQVPFTRESTAALMDEVDAVLTAAEAFKRAEDEWVSQTEGEHRVTPQLFHKWSEAKAALLALFPPPDAKETP